MADRGRVVTGHCLSYGDGITYWPLAEIVKEFEGSDLDGAVADVVNEEAPVVAARIAAAIGSGESTLWVRYGCVGRVSRPSAYPFIAGISLRCREPPQWAINGLPRHSTPHP